MMCTVTCSACLAAGQIVACGMRVMPAGAMPGPQGAWEQLNTCCPPCTGPNPAAFPCWPASHSCAVQSRYPSLHEKYCLVRIIYRSLAIAMLVFLMKQLFLRPFNSFLSK